MHDDDHPLARAYHRLLVWDIMKRPAPTRLAERALNPLIGKSLVLYARKPVAAAAGANRAAGRQDHAAGRRGRTADPQDHASGRQDRAAGRPERAHAGA